MSGSLESKGSQPSAASGERGLDRLLRGPLAAQGEGSMPRESRADVGAPERSPSAITARAAAPARPVPLRDPSRPLAPAVPEDLGGSRDGAVDLQAPAPVSSILAPARVIAPAPRPLAKPSSGSAPAPRLARPAAPQRSDTRPAATSLASAAIDPPAASAKSARSRSRPTPGRNIETIRERIIERPRVERVIERRVVERQVARSPEPVSVVAARKSPSSSESQASAARASRPGASEAAASATQPTATRTPRVGSPEPQKQQRRKDSPRSEARIAPTSAPAAQTPKPRPVEASREPKAQASGREPQPSPRLSPPRRAAEKNRPGAAPRPSAPARPPRPARDAKLPGAAGAGMRPPEPPVTVRIGRIEVKSAKARKAAPKAVRQSARRHQIDPGLGFSGGGR